MSGNILSDLTHRANFPWRLRVLMAMADIRAGELAAASGICQQIIYSTRSGQVIPAECVREKLLLAIEQWHPGTLDMMRAAENSTA